MSENNEIKLKIRVDSEGVTAMKKEANNLMDKANQLLELSTKFSKVNIESVQDIVPNVQKLLDSKLTSTGVAHRSVASLLGLEAEYLSLVRDSEELLSGSLYKRYAIFLRYNPKSNTFELVESKLDIFVEEQSSFYIYGNKAIELYKQTENLINDFMELLSKLNHGDGLRERVQFSRAIELVNIDNGFRLTPNYRLITELTK